MIVNNRFFRGLVVLSIGCFLFFACAVAVVAETQDIGETQSIENQSSEEVAEALETTVDTEIVENTASADPTNPEDPEDHIENPGWKKDNVGWKFINDDGAYLASQWNTIDGRSYYFDASGYMVRGWQRIDGGWYYLGSPDNPDLGAMVIGWRQLDGKWYYFGSNGVMQHGWQQLNEQWYYLGSADNVSSGAMVIEWRKIDGIWYYFGLNGVKRTGWQNINGRWYYFGSDGAMRQGWQNIDGAWYYLGSADKISSGAMSTDWQKIDGKWYYFAANGVMRRGWQKLDGKWYYMGSDDNPNSGAMRHGWLQDGGKWYYFGIPENQESGAMRHGWLEVEGTWYYLGHPDDPETGAMVTGVVNTKASTMKAKFFYFAENGAWQEDVRNTEFEFDGEFYGAADDGSVFKYSNSELISGRIDAWSYSSRLGLPVRKITIHHMAGVMSAESCGNYFATTPNTVSSTYGIGYAGEIYQYVDEKERSHCSSNAENDRQAITIEVSNIEVGGDWRISDASMESLINLCVDICQRNGIEYLNYTGDTSGNLTMHKWFTPTNCPGPYLEARFPAIAEEVNLRLEIDKINTKGWKLIAGKWYFFDESGVVRDRWIRDNGKWYYLRSSGVMASNEFVNGWWFNKDGTWTYPHRASWRQSNNGRWWYGDESGWYAANATYKIDGVECRFDSSGWEII